MFLVGKFIISIIFVLALLTSGQNSAALLSASTDTITFTRISSPYENIDWDNITRLKANLHSHTTASDGSATLQQMIDAYYAQGFDVVAITDHHAFGTDATHYDAGTGMLIIQGVEIGCWCGCHHFNAIFTDDYDVEWCSPNWTMCDDSPWTRDCARNMIRRYYEYTDAIIFLNHPGRHLQQYGFDWYVDIFDRFSQNQLIGLEVFNQANRHPEDLQLWDDLLTIFAPHRPIWGLGNDDAHNSTTHIGLSYNQLLVPSNTIQNVRNSITNAEFFFMTRSLEYRNPNWTNPMPVVNSININRQNFTITVDASIGDTTDPEIRWISRYGNLVGTGATIDFSELRGFVRFEIRAGGVGKFSQPFMLYTFEMEVPNRLPLWLGLAGGIIFAFIIADIVIYVDRKKRKKTRKT